MSNETTYICPCCHRPMNGLVMPEFDFGVILKDVGMRHSANGATIDFRKLTVTRNGKPVHIDPSFWKMLAIIISGGGNPVTRETIYSGASRSKIGTNRSVDTAVANIRKIFGAAIETVHGFGYRWNPSGTTKYEKKPLEKVEKNKTPKAKKTRTPRPPKVKVPKVYLHQLNETVMIPTRKITRVVMDASTPIESNERLYRIRGTHVQWDGTGSPPELIAAYQKARGELPSFITLPLGRIQFQMDGYVATWSGTGAIPDDVLHYLDEYQTLPPMVGKKSRAA